MNVMARDKMNAEGARARNHNIVHFVMRILHCAIAVAEDDSLHNINTNITHTHARM